MEFAITTRSSARESVLAILFLSHLHTHTHFGQFRFYLRSFERTYLARACLTLFTTGCGSSRRMSRVAYDPSARCGYRPCARAHVTHVRIRMQISARTSHCPMAAGDLIRLGRSILFPLPLSRRFTILYRANDYFFPPF